VSRRGGEVGVMSATGTEARDDAFESLPSGTTADDITAEHADGVLTVSTPTQSPVAATRIPITHRELPVE
jgi:hypothetical protein